MSRIQIRRESRCDVTVVVVGHGVAFGGTNEGYGGGKAEARQWDSGMVALRDSRSRVLDVIFLSE